MTTHTPPRAVPLSPRRRALPDATFRPWLFTLARLTLGRLLRLILDVRVSGLEHVRSSGAVLLAGNHRGALDGPVLAACVPRPARFLAKSELFREPLVRPLLWLGQIPVDRGRADRQALRTAVAVLHNGDMLGVFPEGTRGAGAADAVQPGIAYLALRAPGVPIVPVACVGTEVAWPKGSRRPRWRSGIDVVFGAAFVLEPPENARARSAVTAAADVIRLRLAAHVAVAEEMSRLRRGRTAS